MGKLPEEQFEQVCHWLWFGRHSQERALEMADAEGWALPKATAFSEFWLSFVPCLRRAIARNASQTAKEINELADSAEDYSKAIYKDLAREVFEMQMDPARDTKHYLALLDRLARMSSGNLDAAALLLKVKALEQKSKTDETKLQQAARKLVLLESKAASAGETLTDTTLSDEEKTAKMKAIFGIGA